jgi:hypothetical protein
LLANPAEVRLTFDARDRVYVNIDGNASTHERKVNAELTLAGNDVAAAGDALRKFGPRNGMRAPLVGAAVAQGALDRNSAVEYIADMKKSNSTKMWSLSELTRENIFFMRIIHLIWVIMFMFDEMSPPPYSSIDVARFRPVYNAICNAKGVDLFDSSGRFAFALGAQLYEAPFTHGLLRLRTVGAARGFFEVCCARKKTKN